MTRYARHARYVFVFGKIITVIGTALLTTAVLDGIVWAVTGTAFLFSASTLGAIGVMTALVGLLITLSLIELLPELEEREHKTMSVNTRPHRSSGDPIILFGLLFVVCSVGSLVCGFIAPVLFEPLLVGVFISTILLLVSALNEFRNV
jgi:Na+/H+ antiporter NhaD/arsenite permease-like protein